MDLNLLSARQLLDGYATGDFSPVDVAQACLDRIEATQERLNAFCLLDHARTLDAARASEERWRSGAPQGALDGVPVSIKDLIDVAGWPTLCGSRALDPESAVAKTDDLQVARLRAAGAVFLGKTTTTEFGHKGVSDSPLTGLTRNPWNVEMTTGGSSCGAGAAAAAGMGPIHLGNDGGGSVRIPASFCGVIGVKPGAGTLATQRAGITGPLVSSGALSRHASDAALLLDVLARRWPIESDGTRLPISALPADVFSSGLEQDIAGQHIGYLPTISGVPIEPEVAALVAGALTHFETAGASWSESALDLPDAEDTYVKILAAGTSLMVDGLSPGQRERLEPPLLELARVGKGVRVEDYVRAYHGRRSDYMERIRQLFSTYDLLVLPTLAGPAFPLGLDYPGPPGRGWRADWTVTVFSFNLTGLPAATVPCGLTRAGLPVGLQIVAPWGAEALLMSAVDAFTRICPPPVLPEIAGKGPSPDTTTPKTAGAF
ncbi:amidase family protein [Acidimangrovimonas sediminis]|uniref:amidase family protein n=1 Tax=Acidimangrovimonas sediminis TaxID=2056283 RepID=UPI000C805671|nr:amidase family protein [Acidimangrovimonas sediminis]